MEAYKGAPLLAFEAILELSGNRYVVRLTRERHVIQALNPVFMGTFMINGVQFVATAVPLVPQVPEVINNVNGVNNVGVDGNNAGN